MNSLPGLWGLEYTTSCLPSHPSSVPVPLAPQATDTLASFHVTCTKIFILCGLSFVFLSVCNVFPLFISWHGWLLPILQVPDYHFAFSDSLSTVQPWLFKQHGYCLSYSLLICFRVFITIHQWLLPSCLPSFCPSSFPYLNVSSMWVRSLSVLSAVLCSANCKSLISIL